jgi:DNA polymerase III sliding clamp (beta) subunit (PCNA family)
MANRAVRVVGPNLEARVADAGVLKEALNVAKRAKSETSVALALTPQHIRIAMGDVVLVGRLIDGQFPKIGLTPPTAVEVILRRDDFFAAASRCDVIAGPTRMCKVTLAIRKDSVGFSAETPLGSVKDICTAVVAVQDPDEDAAPPPDQVSFKCSYLIDILRRCNSSFLRMSLGGFGTPVFFTPDYQDGENPLSSYLYLLGPVK